MQGAGVHDVKIERDELAAEVELGIVIERGAAIRVQTLLERPGENVAQSVEIEAEVVARLDNRARDTRRRSCRRAPGKG